MTRYFSCQALFFAVFCCFLFPSTRASAQQNLFNVPSGAITPQGDLFFQEQFNINNLAGTSNSTVAFGLGNGWEAGFNLLNYYMYDKTKKLPSDPDKPKAPGNPDLMANLQKGLQVNDFWNTCIGLQAGFNPAKTRHNSYFQNFSWWINSFEVSNHEAFGKWYAGAYYANHNYAGDGNRLGLLLGVEIPIIKDKLAFQADGIMGHNDLSVMVIGGVYTFDNKWMLSLGAQIPTPSSGNSHGVVIEFTYPGFPLERLRR
ncbi:MAG: hypothetical protein NTY98_20525 [Verrucomicrobia bacterium]|nr:hypothetical protein [Verrucomicrobiota bacterium]